MASAGVALVAALAAALPAGVGGQTYVGPEYIPAAQHPVPMWLTPGKQASVASCAIDVGISLVFLGQAGTAINAAVQSCDKKETEQDKAACAASVTGVVAGFGYAAGFLQQAAADCQNSFQVLNPRVVAKAACGADIANFIASLALLANAGSSVRDACEENRRVTRDDDLGFNTRRLKETEPSEFHKLGEKWHTNASAFNWMHRELEQHQISGMNGGKKGGKKTKNIRAPGQPSDKMLRDRSAEMAECVFDVGQATFFLARAMLMINAAVADCSRFELRTGGRPQHTRCAVDVASVVSAFSFVSSGISYAAYHCAFWTTLAPACAGSISNMIAALSQIAASGASFEGTCGFAGRRLSNASEPVVLV